MNRDHRTITNISTFLYHLYSLNSNMYYAYISKVFSTFYRYNLMFSCVCARRREGGRSTKKAKHTHAQHTFHDFLLLWRDSTQWIHARTPVI